MSRLVPALEALLEALVRERAESATSEARLVPALEVAASLRVRVADLSEVPLAKEVRRLAKLAGAPPAVREAAQRCEKRWKLLLGLGGGGSGGGSRGGAGQSTSASASASASQSAATTAAVTGRRKASCQEFVRGLRDVELSGAAADERGAELEHALYNLASTTSGRSQGGQRGTRTPSLPIWSEVPSTT